MIYQFAFHNGVKVKPDMKCKMFLLYEKLERGEDITRCEKDFVTENLYGIWGSHSATYKLGGWAAPFYQVLPRFLVKEGCDNYWREYYAPDKTSIRKVVKGIQEIVEAKKKS